MAVVLPAGTILVSEVFYYTLLFLAMFSTMITLFLVVFIKSKIPEVVSLMKASILKRPWVHIHTSLNELIFDAPKRSGDDQSENCYDMSKFLGLKIVPDPGMVEHTDEGRRVIHYYSKAAAPISAKEAAACRDVIDHLKDRGVRTTESLVDALFIASEEELNEWYGESDPDMLKLVKSLKLELQNKFIRDGQFVWEVVKDFIFAASNETSRSLDEFKSIAHEQADDRFRGTKQPADIKQTLLLFVMVVFVVAVAYKIMFA